MPVMHAFVRDVCDIVAAGAPLVDDNVALQSARDVPVVLKGWLKRVRDAQQLQGFRDAVATTLARRPGAAALRRASDAQLVAAIVDGVAAQQRVQIADATFVLKERVAAMEAIVSHLQLLFDVPALAGAIPCLTRVHAKLSEAQNFNKALRTALGMDSRALPHELLERVRRLAGQPPEYALLQSL